MIHRFRVTNFKSISDMSVELSPVTVLVGRSGTGKSNFVNALRFLRDILSSQPQAANVQQAWGQSRPAAAQSAATSTFAVEFSIAGIEERFKYELELASPGPMARPVIERLDLGNKCLFHQQNHAGQGKWVVPPDLVQALTPGPISLGRIPSISEVVIAFTALTSGIGCYQFSDDVLKSVAQGDFATNLNDVATNFLGTVKGIVSNLEDLNVRKSILASLQRVNSSVSAVELNDLLNPSAIVVGHRFDGKTLALQLSQESDGFRRFYAHLLALYQRPPKQTLVFEHPEDGIYPGALSLLADEFKAAPRNGRGQILLTTHSPKLLDEFDADQIRVVEIDGFTTRIGNMSDEQREAIRDKLLDPGELLTTDPARMQREAAAQ
jgi:predicted ATPase